MQVNIFFATAAFVVVSAVTAGAEDHQGGCDSYSSTAGGARTLLQFQPDPNRSDFALRKDDEEQYWQIAGSAGTGLAGTVYTLRGKPDDEGGVLYSSSIVLDHNSNPPKEIEILIFLDMVFWPDCK
jgi:hypothetical protein